VAVQSKVWVCGSSLAGIAGLNPAEDMDVSLLWVLCVVRRDVSASGQSLVQRSPTVCDMSECDGEASIMRRCWPLAAVASWKNCSKYTKFIEKFYSVVNQLKGENPVNSVVTSAPISQDTESVHYEKQLLFTV